MANRTCSAFSSDGQFLAICGTDGKLKIWETATNCLKQEYVPNLHLASPCSVISWITAGVHSTNPTSWKKRKRKTIDPENHKHVIAMGSTNGSVTLYDVSSSSVSDQLQDSHKSSVTALTWSQNAGLFSVSNDKHIIEWNLQEKSIKCRWKSGKSKVTSLTVLPDGKSLLSGEILIKWWDLSTKQVIGTFTGHASHVSELHCVKISEDTSYLFSCAKGDDHYISVWSLNDVQKDTSPVASLALPGEPLTVSVKVSEESQIQVVSTTKSGEAQLFKYQVNGTSSKPLKPALNIFVASDSAQNEAVQKIPIINADLTEDNKLLLAFGLTHNLSIEKVTPDFSDNVQCLVRSSTSKLKEKKEEAISRVKVTETDNCHDYFAQGPTSSPGTKRTKLGNGLQLPLQERLENLSLDVESILPEKSPTKCENMAHLLIQALTSKDKKLLSTVLFVKNENVIKNTIAKLPVQAILPLMKEICAMIRGKIYVSKIAMPWLKALMFAQSAQIINQPNTAGPLTTIMNHVKDKLALRVNFTEVLGKVNLTTSQLTGHEKEDEDFKEECLLVYEDDGSSDEDSNIYEMDQTSESDDNWEELTDQKEQNGKTDDDDDDDDASICSSIY